MADRGLDPAGPILAVLFGAKSSDLVVDVVTGAGLRVDWSLNDRQNYSNSTRIREYRVRVAAALNELSDNLSPEAMSRIALVAAAAVADESAWGSFLGEWLTELAFLEMTLDEAVNLRSQLHMLLHIDPTLWETCGRADAAVGAYLDSSSAAVP